MKSSGHPNYVECKVQCACGASFVTGSVLPEIRVSICSACHPFYTGQEKLVDTEGRVDRFKKRYAAKPATKNSVAASAA